MDFEQAYENYKNGTASDEEKTYVESEIAKARRLSLIIDELDSKKAIAPSDINDVKKAKAKHSIKSVVSIILIVFACLVLLTGVTCAGVFGQAFSSADKNTVCNAAQAEALALDFLLAKGLIDDTATAFVSDQTEREIVFTANLEHCYYDYYVEIQTASGVEFELLVNGKLQTVDFDKYD